MASIQNSRAKKYARLTEGDEPTEHLESIGDSLIKELAKKQTDTALTLEKQFNQEKKFEKGIGFVPLSSFAAGTSSLEDFQKINKDAENICNTNKAEHSAEKTQQDKQHEHNTGELSRLSRQVRELALSVKPNSVETQLMQFALNCKQPTTVDSRPESHPINNLAQIEKERFKEHAEPLVLIRTMKRKRMRWLEAGLPAQYVRSNPATAEGASRWDMVDKPNSDIYPKINGPIEITKYRMRDGKMEEVDETTESLSDQEKPYDLVNMVVNSIEIPDSLKHLSKEEVKKIRYSETRCYTIKDGKIMKVVNGQHKNISEKEVIKYKGERFIGVPLHSVECCQNERLSEEEIKQMPKFKNYERGELNKVLYIKNLSKDVKEEDLVKIFCQFEEQEGPKLVYRLLSGKMRRQAFVTFPSADKAASALKIMNGLMFKGKPLVIAFGRNNIE